MEALINTLVEGVLALLLVMGDESSLLLEVFPSMALQTLWFWKLWQLVKAWKFALELGFQDIEIEGDAQKSIRIILRERPTQTNVAVVVTDLWELQGRLRTCKLNFVRITTNGVCSLLGKESGTWEVWVRLVGRPTLRCGCFLLYKRRTAPFNLVVISCFFLLTSVGFQLSIRIFFPCKNGCAEWLLHISASKCALTSHRHLQVPPLHGCTYVFGPETKISPRKRIYLVSQSDYEYKYRWTRITKLGTPRNHLVVNHVVAQMPGLFVTTMSQAIAACNHYGLVHLHSVSIEDCQGGRKKKQSDAIVVLDVSNEVHFHEHIFSLIKKSNWIFLMVQKYCSLSLSIYL